MENYQKLTSLVHEAKEKLSDVTNERDAFLEPILEVLGATGGGISFCSTEDDLLHITRSGSSRGCSWDDYYRFPLGIFNHAEPLIAAAKYVSEKKSSKEKAEREAKLKEITRLQKELGQI